MLVNDNYKAYTIINYQSFIMYNYIIAYNILLLIQTTACDNCSCQCNCSFKSYAFFRVRNLNSNSTSAT